MDFLGGLVGLIVALIILGAVLWLVSLLPIDSTIKQIIQGLAIILVIIFVLFWLLGLFGYVNFPAVHFR